MKKTVSWKNSNGQEITVVAELVTSRTRNADGHKVTGSCCEIEVAASVDGVVVGTGRPRNRRDLPPGYKAVIGRLALDNERYKLVMAAIAELEASPEWLRKIADLKAAVEGDEWYRRHTEKMKKAMSE